MIENKDKKLALPAPLHPLSIYNTIVGETCAFEERGCGRVSAAMTRHQVDGIVAAAVHATKIGLPFNRHITIRLERAGIADKGAVKAIGRFLALVRDWLRKQGHKTSYVWARERGDTIGSHVHILIHLPDGVVLGSRTRKWIERVAGRKYRPGAVMTKTISKAAYHENLANLVAYLCKGASRAVAEELDLPRRQDGGRVIGKRAGWSQNIGAKARREYQTP